MGIAQRANEKNEIIFLVIMFTSRVMVSKMSKMAHCQKIIKNSYSFSKIFKCI